MHAFEIERQTHQTHLSSRSQQAAQRELAEPQNLLDDPNHRFNGAFSIKKLSQPPAGLWWIHFFHLP